MTIEQQIIDLLKGSEKPLRIPTITRHVATQHECRVGRIVRSLADRGVVRIHENNTAGTPAYSVDER